MEDHALLGLPTGRQSMTVAANAVIWMVVAAGLAVALAVIAAAHSGTGKLGTEAALRLTARLAFIFFWPSYVGGALVTLFGPKFQPVRRRAREFGLAYASVLTVHLVLIGWLCWIGSAPAARTFAIFGVGVFWTCLLALFSIERLGRGAGTKGWWVLRNIGMNYLAFAFALDFLPPLNEPTARHLVAYLPFAMLAILGPALRVGAVLKLTSSRQRGMTPW